MDSRTQITDQLKILAWNINGVAGKREYFNVLLNDYDAEVIIIGETKLRRPINQKDDIDTRSSRSGAQ